MSPTVQAAAPLSLYRIWQAIVFWPSRPDTLPAAVIRARLPSRCAVEPSELHRSAENAVIAGRLYALTVSVSLAVAVRPRESVTVTLSVRLPDADSALDAVKLAAVYVAPSSTERYAVIVLPRAPAAVIATSGRLTPWTYPVIPLGSAMLSSCVIAEIVGLNAAVSGTVSVIWQFSVPVSAPP